MPRKLTGSFTIRHEEASLIRVKQAYSAGSEEEQHLAVSALAASRLTFEEYVRELAVLGLRKREHSAEDYAAALGTRIGRQVGISVLSKAEYMWGGHSAADVEDSFGRLVFVPQSTEIRVEVPEDLSPWLHHFTVGHELGHLAAAHPPLLSTVGASAGTGSSAGSGFVPPVRLARKPPLLAGDLPPEGLVMLYEAEADLRAQYAIITGNLGPVVTQNSKLSQIS